ncbi:MAG: hypothetical protein N2315_07725 [Thermanaerothrix sp.]|nr:hypothetical protein [Thermanaerothrix sp.]
MRRVLLVISASVLMSFLAAGLAFGSMNKREQGVRLGMDLRARIMSESYHSRSDLALWRKLLNDPSSSPKERIGAGLALADRLFPEGDLSRWEDIRGFLGDSGVPKSLAAADAVLFTSYLAVEALPSGEGMWLAYVLMEPFFRSDSARMAFGRTCPAPVAEMMKKMAQAGVAPPEGWPEPFDVVGFLPLGAPVSGSVSPDQVALYGMWRMDREGRIRLDAKDLAWDREEGAVYRISGE